MQIYHLMNYFPSCGITVALELATAQVSSVEKLMDGLKH